MLGQLPDAVGSTVDDAVDYLRAQWDRFTGLSREIIDLQHRAALVAQRATEAGDVARADQVKGVIRALGAINVQHGRALDTMRSVAEYVGLAGYRGLGALGVAIPAAQLTVISTLALVVAWVFRAYAAEARKLDLIEAGILTPEQAAALDPGPAPGAVLAGLGRLGTLAVVAFLAWLAWSAWTARPRPASSRGRGRRRRNPPLAILHRNPPADAEPFGREVEALYYVHADDDRRYVHEFGPGVRMDAEPDGSVRIYHPSRRVWREFSE